MKTAPQWIGREDQNLLRITNPVSDLTGTSSSMSCFEVVILEITIQFFLKICMGDSAYTTHHT
jgi:hypothetical protein